MTQHVETLRDITRIVDLYERFSHGDADSVDELFAEDVVCHLLGDSMLSGDYRGRDALRDFLARTIEMNGTRNYTVTVQEVLQGPVHVAILAAATGKGAESAETVLVHDLLRLNEAGQVGEMWSSTLPG